MYCALCLCSVLVMTACNSGALSGKDYVNYIENEKNGLKHSKQINELSYQLQYCPAEYLLIKEYKTFDVSQKLLDAKINTKDSMLNFQLRIQNTAGNGDVLNTGSPSKEDYYNRIEFLSYGFEESIALINSKDTIYPAIYHFERTYGVAPYADILFAFNASKFMTEDVSVIINDRVFNNGLLKFTLTNTDRTKLPKLKAN